MPAAKHPAFSRKTKQLTIICEDRPGTLSRLAKLLGAEDVNIVAMCCAPFGIQGTVHIVVDNVKRAKSVLDRECISYTEQDVLHVEMKNMPGRLGEFAGELAKENINITTAYGSSIKKCKQATVIFRVSDLERAARIRF